MNKESNIFKNIISVLLTLLILGVAAGMASAAQAPVNLGTADNFVILSKSGITNVPTSAITGNIGTSPITGAAITGLDCSEVTGTVYTVDAAGPACRVVAPVLLTAAVSDMETAYTDAAGRTNPTATELGAGNIGGMTLAPGLYKWSSGVTIPTDVTLSGNPTDVWIFQIAGTLDISNGKQVILSGGAQAKNIYWQVAGATRLGTTSVFNGNILAQTNIAIQTGATLNGRALAQTAVTLQKNVVTAPINTATTVGSVQAPVDLRTADNFVILSKSGITNVPTSAITGNIGTSPITGASITGLDDCSEVTGTVYTVDAAGPACRVVAPVLLTTAVSDMETAYTDAAGRTLPDATELGAGNIGGMTLTPGLYKWSSGVTIPTDVTLSGGANDVWIFQIAGTLDISNGKQVILSGGAQAKNIFWQVAGATTLGTYSTFNGNILDKTNIAIQTGATLNGRALAQTAVTLDANNVTAPSSGGGTVPPRHCRDFVTGGGWINGSSDVKDHKSDKNNKATFGVSGGIKNDKFWGQLSYNDHGKDGVKVKSTKVTAYTVIDPVTRQIEGIARVNGKGSVTYKVVVVDNGESGRNDSFSLNLSNGYNASGTLKGGNIQIHTKCGKSHDKDDKENCDDKDEKEGHNNCGKDSD